MKVALVHDYLTQYGGAERVLEAFCEIYPDAPIYTLLYDEKLVREKFPGRKVYASFLQNVPFARKRHRSFLVLMPLAIEQFDLSGYDLVISDTASYAKGVITLPSTKHICYCHTPTRYAWDDSHKYIRDFPFPGFIKKFIPYFMTYIRTWDFQASQRPDFYLANSNFVAQRLEKYYKQKAEVAHPPVDISKFYISKDQGKAGEYFLMVGRLLSYKKFDLAISAFSKTGLPLKVVGDGPERKKLEKIAGKNVEFFGALSDDELRGYYQKAKALIFPQEEDFGIVPLEAMACGRPVIAYRAGGAKETVVEGVTGIFYDSQTEDAIIDAVERFKKMHFDSKLIREHSLKFSKDIFKEKIKKIINEHRF
ncbi:glycosyltransferase [Candidatus Azambacteria bacterium]|nr:glycosyltransferase [Candidatus Azambacteria bacterium]